jgi:AcrR family transcriptional regulator
VFGSKEELYRAVIKRLTDDLVSYVNAVEIPEAPDFDETLSVLVQRLWQSLIDEPGTHLLLTELSVIALRSPQLRNLLEEHRRMVDSVTGSLIQAAADRTGVELAQDPILLAQFFLAGFDGLTQQHLAAPDIDSEQWRLNSLVSATAALALGRLRPDTDPLLEYVQRGRP